MTDGEEKARLKGGRRDYGWHWFLRGLTSLGHDVMATAAAGELHVASKIRGAHMLLREGRQSIQ